MRELLLSAFGGEDLRELCFDYFPEVYAQFTDGQTQSGRVQLLMEHVWRQDGTTALLNAIQQKNPRKYAEFIGRLSGPTAVSEKVAAEGLYLEPVPARPLFIGREQELAFYRRMLAEERFVIISGLAGVGKTTLGARLAREAAASADSIFWFTFDTVQKNGSEALLRALAVFLTMHGQPDLGRYLDGEIKVQKPLDLTAKLNLFIAGLASGDYLLCFDDFHLIKERPDIALLFKQIRDRYPGPGAPLPARFIIMGRDMPQAMQYLAPETLNGFSQADTREFLQANRVSLSDAQIPRLWQITAGNAKLLELSVAAFSRLNKDPNEITRFLDTMPERRDLRDFVMHEIYASLTPTERLIADALSIFPTDVERAVLEAVLEGEDVGGIVEPLNTLADKHLLSESDGRIGCHGLVREFSYRLLSRQNRESFHGRAANYYERERQYLAAAYHHFEQGTKEQATDLLTSHRQEIIYGGEAGALLEQLARFNGVRLDPQRRSSIHRLTGDCYKLRGEYGKALQAYGDALAEPNDSTTQAALVRCIGDTHTAMGDYEQALSYLTRSAAISQQLNDRSGLADAHVEMGIAAYRLFRLDDARVHLEQAHRLADELGDRLLAARASMTLGVVDWEAGDLTAARTRIDSSLYTFRALGNRLEEARAVGNLALLYQDSGNLVRALALHRDAVAIQEQIGDVNGLRIALHNLGYLHLKLQQYSQATECYEQLARLARATGHQRMVSIAQAGLADAHLGLGDPQGALGHIEQAIAAAESFPSGGEMGINYNIQGKIWLALGDPAQARACFERSIPLLEGDQESEDLAEVRQGLAQAIAQMETAG
jgi:tetratricopeptide (TPR) repeat protein